jgi:microcin C transport system ATP-binding protein
MLDIEKLSLAINNKNILKDISLSLAKGEIAAIVGESGSGKSILAKQILKINDISNLTSKGKILLNNIDLNNLDEKKLREIRGNKISMIFQEPMTSLNPVHNIKKQINEIIFLHEKLTKNQCEKKIKELLKIVGLEYLNNRGKIYPHQLSGGERQRVMIAMAIACSPQLIIADEPTTSLDNKNSNNIIKLLKDIAKNQQISVIFISHDINLVKKIADKILVMHNGKIIESGSKKAIFESPKTQYTKDLLGTNLTKQNRKILPNSELMVQIKNLNLSYFHYQGLKKIENQVLKDINISIKKGETVGLIGESGSGKTSLAESILKLRNASGEIIIDGVNLNTLKKEELRCFRKNMQIIFQDPFASLNPRQRIIDILKEVTNAHKITKSTEIIKRLLPDVNFKEDILTRFPDEFSGGERQRIVILRALCLLPKFIILDEPTASLDASTQKTVITLLKKLQTKYDLSYLLITHDKYVLESMSHRYYHL